MANDKSLMGIIIERLKKNWYYAWLVTICSFMCAIMHMICPTSLEVSSALGNVLCMMGFGFTTYVFLFDIFDSVIAEHKSKHE